MKNAKYASLICITVIFFIALFNYIIDPYKVFHSDKINISEILIDEPYIPLKLHQKKKYKYVVFGGSTFKQLRLENYNNEIANVCYPLMKIEDLDKIIFAFLDMHRETKTVLLPLDFIATGVSHKNTIPNYTGKNLNFKEINKLFFSAKTTKYSFKKLLDRNNISHNNEYIINLKKTSMKKANSQEFLDKGLKAYSNIFKKLKERNIQVICFSAPFPAHALVYLNELYGYDAMAELKKFIVKQNGSLIDLGIVNKLTSKPLEEQFFLFSDSFHPKALYGYFAYNILFNTQEKDDKLYYLLTNDNVYYVTRKYLTSG